MSTNAMLRVELFAGSNKEFSEVFNQVSATLGIETGRGHSAEGGLQEREIKDKAAAERRPWRQGTVT